MRDFWLPKKWVGWLVGMILQLITVAFFSHRKKWSEKGPYLVFGPTLFLGDLFKVLSFKGLHRYTIQNEDVDREKKRW